MRVTQGMLTQQFLYNITNIQVSMQQSEQQLSTGKTLNNASDNPLAVSQDMAIRSSLSDVTGYQSAVSSGLTWMNNTTSALQSIISSLQTISTDVESALNVSSQSTASLTALSKTVSQVQKGISETLDSKQGNRFLFGGTSAWGSASPGSNPANATGVINYEISGGVQVQVNVNAADIMNVSGTQVKGNPTQDLQTTLGSIVADLQSGNVTNLQQDYANLTAHLNNVVSINADLGTRVQRLTAMQNQLAQYSTTLTNEKGVVEGANMAQVITQFTTQQTVYNAALKMGSEILQPSLVSFLPNG